jgi:hypothetical protein
MFAFFLTDIFGGRLLQGQTADFKSLLAAARTLQEGYPASTLTCLNGRSGAIAVFVAQFPDFVTYMREYAHGREVLGTYDGQSDVDIWVHLTDDGYYDTEPDPLDFLGRPCMLEAVQLTSRILLN